MPRLSVYMVLGLLDGYYTTMVLVDLAFSSFINVVTVTVLINAVTGLLSSYVLNTAYLRDVERRLLVKRGYLAGSTLHRGLMLKSVVDTAYWVVMSIIGSLAALSIKYASSLIIIKPLTPVLYVAVPLVFMYLLSKITDTSYVELAVLTLILTLLIYLVLITLHQPH